MQQRLERAEPGIDPLLADGEQLGLGAVDRFLDLGWVLVSDPGDPPGRTDEAAQHRLALHDPGVLGGMDRGGRLIGEAGEVRPATDRLELVPPFQGLGHRHDVDRFATIEQVQDRRVDAGVGLPIEVLRAQELSDLDDRIPVDQDRPEHGLLSLKTLRRQTVDHRLTDCRQVLTR